MYRSKKNETKKRPKKIIISLAVWGEQYWSDFLDVTLFSRLSKDNLPLLANHFECVFHIHTQPNEVSLYKDHKNLKTLNDVVPLKILPIENWSAHKHKYFVMGDVQQKELNSAFEEQTAVIIDTPDLFYGQNVFKECLQPMLSGKRVIFAPCHSLDIKAFKNHKIYQQKIENRLLFEEKELVQVGLDCLHSTRTSALIVNQKESVNYWAYRFWKISSDTLVQKGFHAHPFYIFPESTASPISMTIDEMALLYQYCPTKKAHHYLHSQDFHYYELSHNSYHQKTIKEKVNLLDCFIWSKYFAHPSQFNWFYKSKYFSVHQPKVPFSNWLQIAYYELGLNLLKLLPETLIKPFLWKTLLKARVPNVSDLYKLFLKKYHLHNYHEFVLIRYSSYFSLEMLFEFIKNHRKCLRNHVLSRFLITKSLAENLDYDLFFKTSKSFQCAKDIVFQILLHNIYKKNTPLIFFCFEHKFLESFSNKQLNKITRALARRYYVNYLELILKHPTFSSVLTERTYLFIGQANLNNFLHSKYNPSNTSLSLEKMFDFIQVQRTSFKDHTLSDFLIKKSQSCHLDYGVFFKKSISLNCSKDIVFQILLHNIYKKNTPLLFFCFEHKFLESFSNKQLNKITRALARRYYVNYLELILKHPTFSKALVSRTKKMIQQSSQNPTKVLLDKAPQLDF